MKALFVELPAFERHRSRYLDDEQFRRLQVELMGHPEGGDVIAGTGGLRIIYYWWKGGSQFWLFTLYDKDEIEDLSAKEKAVLKGLLDTELRARQ